MNQLRASCFAVLIAIASSVVGVPGLHNALAAAQSKPAEMQVTGSPIPIRVLVQSPVETASDLQVICLFASAPQSTLQGALAETNEKLKGLLEQIRKPAAFRGDLGETLSLVPPPGSLSAKRLMIIGLGDSETFTPQRMELVGTIVYRESNRLGVAHPFFAPTVLDGGVKKYGTGEVAEAFVSGFLRADRTHRALETLGAANTGSLEDLTYLAGPAHAADTKQGIEKAVATAATVRLTL
jgi:hypothetical protein